jgi:hypothetical protein
MRLRVVGHIECIGQMTISYNILNGKPEKKVPVRRPRRVPEVSIEQIVP